MSPPQLGALPVSSRSGGRVLQRSVPAEAERTGQLASTQLPAAAVPSGQRRAPAHGGSGRRGRQPSPGTLGRPARPEPSPAWQRPGADGSWPPARRDTPSGPRPASRSGPEVETPAAATAVTAKTSLQITCPRRSPGPAAVTAKTPKSRLEITAGTCARAGGRPITFRDLLGPLAADRAGNCLNTTLMPGAVRASS